MSDEVTYSARDLDFHSKASIRITSGWRDGTEIVHEQHDVFDQAIDNEDSDYNLSNDDADTYDADDDSSQYDYDPNPVISGVNPYNNIPPQKHQ